MLNINKQQINNYTSFSEEISTASSIFYVKTEQQIGVIFCTALVGGPVSDIGYFYPEKMNSSRGNSTLHVLINEIEKQIEKELDCVQ